ncbi:MAG TPA: DUF5916 domain-containing protein [Thermoanaerobaculia bacterium]|nr:DUF5916 domain-containing protein [Thermoanaerobaculia bacterium]
MRCALRSAILLGWLVPAAALPALSASPPGAVVAAAPASSLVVLDGSLDEPAWEYAGIIPDLTQQEPEPGRPTPFDATRISVLTDGVTLYVGIVCPDPEPEKIAVHTLQRDAEMDGDDTLAFVLDTFGDGRTGYLFRVNAGGARQDGLISGKEGVSLDWDGLWDARVRRTALGWTAEIAISARSLRFRPGLERWGFNVERTVARDRLTLRWAAISRDARLEDLQRAGTLAGVAGLRQGLGLSFVPYALGRSDDRRDAPETRREGETGFDLSYNLTPELGAVLTVNTDFAETEVDTRQINLTRFPLFFPEKRSFFLEGSNLFAFGSGIEEDFIPFYSRRVGLVRGRVVPLDAGLKLLGRAGRWSIAALDAETGDSSAARATNLFAGRATYDLGEHLRVGALATRGDPDGEEENALAGLDALWQTSSFRGDKNLAFGAWAAQSDGDLDPGQRSGWGFKADYPNDLWDVFLTYREFGDALEPALGFLPRPGTRQAEGGGSFQPRPGDAGPFSWVRQFFFELFLSRVDRLDGTTESWRVFTAPWNAVTRSGEHLEANWAPEFERLDEPFEVAAGVVIPPGEYQFTRWRVEGQSARSRPWRVGSTVWFGDFFDGRLTQWESFVYWTFGPGRLRLELAAENNFGDLPQGDFVQRLWQWKTVYAASPDLVVSLFTQYDSESRGLGLNSRLRWTIRPGRDLFLVWNRNWQRTLDPGYRLELDSDQIVVKLRWTTLW